MGLRKCCVPGCEDTTSPRQTFPNPRKDVKGRFYKWLEVIRNPELLKMQPTDIHKRVIICRVHFSEKQFYGNNRQFRLSDSAIPDRFLPVDSDLESSAPLNGIERNQPASYCIGNCSSNIDRISLDVTKSCSKVVDCDLASSISTSEVGRNQLASYYNSENSSNIDQISLELTHPPPEDICISDILEPFMGTDKVLPSFSEYCDHIKFELSKSPSTIFKTCFDALSSSDASIERTQSVCNSSEESCNIPSVSPDHVEESSEVTEVVLEDGESDEKSVLLENVKEELCRICGHTDNSLMPIFGDTFRTRNLSLPLPEVLEMHLPLELHADDQFPPNICSKCLNTVSEWHELYATCTAADTAFRNAFGRRKVEESSIPCEKLPEEELQQSVVHSVLEDHDYIQEMHETGEEKFQSPVDVPVLKEHHYVQEVPGVGDEEFGSSVDFSILDKHDFVPEKYEIREACEGFSYERNQHYVEFVPSNIPPSVIFHKKKYQENYKIRKENNGFPFEKNEQCIELVSSNISPKEIFQKKKYQGKYTSKSNVFKQFEMTECLQLSIPSEESANKGVKPNYIQIVFSDQETESVFEESLETVNSYVKCNVDPREKFICKYCLESFKDKEQLNVHKKQCQENSTICEICGRKVINRNLVRHKTRKHGKQVICDKCGKGVNKRQWYTHMKSAHSDARYCEVCCSVISSSLAYTAHVKNHASEKSTSTFPFIIVSFDGKSVYMCPVCDKSFDDKISIIVHFNEPMCVKCPKCRITFKNKKRFILHQCKFWNCQFCMKNFYNRLQWKEHERIHTGERPHKCPECNISFRTMSQKTAHVRNHRAPAHECKYCCKKFWLPGKLVDHMKRIHEGVRYTCRVCNKIFSRNSSMKKHLQNHLREVKHFSCEVCDKKFTREINMKKHLQKHVLKVQL